MTNLVDTEVLADVHHPSTQASSSAGLVPDELYSEVWVADVLLFHCIYTVHWDVVLVKVKQALQEGIHVAHVLLASRPTEILGNFATRSSESHASSNNLQTEEQQPYHEMKLCHFQRMLFPEAPKTVIQAKTTAILQWQVLSAGTELSASYCSPKHCTAFDGQDVTLHPYLHNLSSWRTKGLELSQ